MRGLRGGFLLAVLLVAGVGCLPDEDPATRSGDPGTVPPATPPLADAGYAELTPHGTLLPYLETLADGSSRITLETLGTSVEGRRIPYLLVSLDTFGANREDRVVVLAYAQQHGNEPAGKEGALALALELARGDHDDLLEHVDLLLVPQVNPDGGDAHQRQNAAGVDLNRSHLILDGEEVVALRTLFHRWEPEVAVDIHEYYPWSGAWLSEGWLRLFDMQIGLPTNLNVSPDIRGLAEDSFLPYAIDALAEQGFTAHNYIVGSPESLRWSTTNVNDGRQGLAILNTLSFIFEGKRSEPLAEEMERRAEAQRLTLETLLRFAAEHRTEVLEIVRGARAELEAGDVGEFVLTMGRDRGPAPLEIPVLAVEEAGEDWVVGDTVTARIEGWYPEVVPDRVTSLPIGYLIPGGHDDLVALLEAHGVEMEALDAGTTLSVERLTLTGFRSHTLEGTIELPDVSREAGARTVEEGDLLVPTGQLRGLLVATALEPESMHGLLRYDGFRELAAEGPYPILRVIESP